MKHIKKNKWWILAVGGVVTFWVGHELIKRSVENAIDAQLGDLGRPFR